VNTATTLKKLALLGLASLSLAAASSQADNSYDYGNYDRVPNVNPWVGAAPNLNPWINRPGYQQARFAAALKQRQAQLDERQDAQMQRILNGMESGRLTLREATGLLREHLDIAKLERGYMADGRLGPNELASLEQRLNEAERHITFEQRDREKADRGDRPGEMGRPVDMDRRGDMNRSRDMDGRGDMNRSRDMDGRGEISHPGEYSRR